MVKQRLSKLLGIASITSGLIASPQIGIVLGITGLFANKESKFRVSDINYNMSGIVISSLAGLILLVI